MTNVKYDFVFIFYHVGAALSIGIEAEIAISLDRRTLMPGEVYLPIKPSVTVTVTVISPSVTADAAHKPSCYLLKY